MQVFIKFIYKGMKLLRGLHYLVGVFVYTSNKKAQPVRVAPVDSFGTGLPILVLTEVRVQRGRRIRNRVNIHTVVPFQRVVVHDEAVRTLREGVVAV